MTLYALLWVGAFFRLSRDRERQNFCRICLAAMGQECIPAAGGTKESGPKNRAADVAISLQEPPDPPA